VPFEECQQLRDARDTGKMKMFEGSSGSLGHCRTHPCRPILGDYHPVGTCGLRSSQQGPEIPWIFYPIQNKEKGGFSPTLGLFEKLLDLNITNLRNLSNDPLVISAPRQARQGLAVQELDRNPSFSRKGNDPSESRIPPLG